MWRSPLLIGIIWILVILESNCGGGASTPPPSGPKLSIATAGLVDGMVTFPYSQTMQAAGGVAPFVWGVSSGSLPHNIILNSSTANISGTPDTAQLATFTIQVKDANGQTAVQSYTLNISSTGLAQLQTVSGQIPPGTIEIQGVSAGSFNPLSWQQDTLNWVPDVRMPMLAPLSGAFQNIYAPWPLEQASGWRMFYGGWDGTDTSNDRVYSVTTPDFLSFGSRQLVIDHGDFLDVNNENVVQLPDGSMHMICTIAVDQFSNGKPAYFSSPDGIIWNGTPEPYSAQFGDVVSIPNDSNYLGWDFNGGNVLFKENNAWTLYYSVGIYGAIGQVYRGSSVAPPVFQRTGVALGTPHYANDIKKFQAGGKTWYLMALYIEEAVAGTVPSPSFSYSLSNDGVTFASEHSLFGGAFPQDHFVMTPAFVTKDGSILGVLYGANPLDLLNAANQIFARWLQKKVVITDSSGAQYTLQGGYGPDRQWFQLPSSGSLQATITVYAEDGITPLGAGPVIVTGGKAYSLVLN
ncbi:MAG: Ig family protein [Acidobacteriaceae bacterium]|nr:Ig family protein [Acidobacteriaceae bacterium]